MITKILILFFPLIICLGENTNYTELTSNERKIAYCVLLSKNRIKNDKNLKNLIRKNMGEYNNSNRKLFLNMGVINCIYSMNEKQEKKFKDILLNNQTNLIDWETKENRDLLNLEKWNNKTFPKEYDKEKDVIDGKIQKIFFPQFYGKKLTIQFLDNNFKNKMKFYFKKYRIYIIFGVILFVGIIYICYKKMRNKKQIKENSEKKNNIENNKDEKNTEKSNNESIDDKKNK